MKQFAKSIAKRILHRLAPPQPPPLPAPLPPLELFFSALHQARFAPSHILDVGAHRGTWTRRAIEYFPRAKYTLIEPQDHLKEYVSDLLAKGHDISWINAAVSDTSGQQQFTIAHRDDSSTLMLSTEQAQRHGLKQVLVEVKTINEILSHGAPTPEIVKIDAEGYDLKALAGASDLFGKTDIFFLEALVWHDGHDNTFLKVIRKMEEIGYRFVDITDLNRSPKHGVLWLCEMAFLKNDSLIFDSVRTYE